MTTPNGITRHQRFDWVKFKEYIEQNKCNPELIALAHEDIRRWCILIEYQHAGYVDQSYWQWKDSSFFLDDPEKTYEDVKYEQGDWIGTAFDVSHGMHHYDPLDIPESGSGTHTEHKLNPQTGRWLKWCNYSKVTYTRACKDPVNKTSEWLPGQTCQSGYIKSYQGRQWRCLLNDNTNAPCTLIRISPSVKLQVNEGWSLEYTAVPETYYDTTNQRIQTKIHPDTWENDRATHYEKDDIVSWQGSWQLMADWDDFTYDSGVNVGAIMNTPPHLWANDVTDITTYGTPSEEGETWREAKWGKGQLVRDNESPNVKVYRAKKDVENTQENQTIEGTHPKNLSEYWEEVPELFVFWAKVNTNGYAFTSSGLASGNNWVLMNSDCNYIHDFDRGLPTRYIHNEIHKLTLDQNDPNSQQIAELNLNIPCYMFWPTQVDPREQREHIIYAYRYNGNNFTPGTFSDQRGPYYTKVPIDTLQITDPDTLGAVFTADRCRADRSPRQGGGAYEIHWHVDGLGVLDRLDVREKCDFPGNQYWNTKGLLWNTPPLDIADQEDVWTVNEKMKGAIQNHLEAQLSDPSWKLPADNAFKINWIAAYHAGYSSDLDLLEDYNAYPSVCDRAWRCNEAGYETFLQHTGKYDWMFQMDNPYVPYDLIYSAHDVCVQEVPFTHGMSPDDVIDSWNLFGVGSYRKTARYSNGRLPFVRDGEREGTPDGAYNLEATHPWAGGTHTETYGVYPSPAYVWQGSYVRDMPTIDVFDTEFVSITFLPPRGWSNWLEGMIYKKYMVVKYSNKYYWCNADLEGQESGSQDTVTEPPDNDKFSECTPYGFSISGNWVDEDWGSGEEHGEGEEYPNLKPGYMVHLCNTGEESISDVQPAYILDLHYNADTGNTEVLLSEPITYGNGYYAKIGFDINVCRRHDAVAATWWRNEGNSGKDDYIEYKLHYQTNPQLLLDLKELLDFVIYKKVNPGLSVSSRRIHSYATCAGTGIPNQAQAIKNVGAIWGAVRPYLGSPNGIPDFVIIEPESQLMLSSEVPPERIDDIVAGIYEATPEVDGGTIGTTITTAPQWPPDPDHLGGSACMNFMYFSATWPDPLVKPPKFIIIKIMITDLQENTLFPIADNKQFFFPQTVDVAGLTLTSKYIEWPEEPVTRYNQVSISPNGFTYIVAPQKWFPCTTYPSFHPPVELGQSWVNLHMGYDPDDIIVVLDLDSLPEDAYQVNYYHIDAPRVLVRDNKCPIPETPIFYKDPTAYLKYVLPYDLLPDEDNDGEKDDCPSWRYEQNYNQGDMVYLVINHFVHYFIAKNNIVNIDVFPILNPEEWEWQVPWVELRLNSKCCICQDEEYSLPVTYQLECIEDDSLTTEFIENTEVDELIHEVSLVLSECRWSSEQSLAQLLETVDWESGHSPGYSEGELVRHGDCIYRVIVEMVMETSHPPEDNPDEYSKVQMALPMTETELAKFYVGDVIETICCPEDDIYKVEYKGSNYMTLTSETSISTGWSYIWDELVKEHNRIINRTQTYNAAEWYVDSMIENVLIRDYTFTFQAKDNASQIQGMNDDNYTNKSVVKTIVQPSDYIKYFDEAQNE